LAATIYLYMYVCLQIFATAKRLLQSAGQPPDAWHTVDGQTVGVCNIFPSALCRCHWYVSSL